MLKKSLMAAGVLALMSSTAQAAPTFAFTALKYSAEGASKAIALASPAITTTLGANYAVDDLITIDMNAAHAAAYTTAASITALKMCKIASGAAVPVASMTATNNGGTMTLGVLSADKAAGSATYRVTGITNTVVNTDAGNAAAGTKCITSTNSTVGAQFAYTPSLLGSAVRAAGAISGTFSATLSNGSTVIDGGLTAINDGATPAVTNTATVVSQYKNVAASNVKWDGVIDVAPANGEPARSVFTVGANTAARSADVMTIDVVETAGTTSPVTVDAITATIKGDFSWIDDKVLTDVDTAATGIDQNTLTATCAGNAATSVAVNADAVTVVCASTDIGDVVLTMDAENNVGATNPAVVQAITAGSYTATIAVKYTDLGTDLAGAGAVATNVATVVSDVAAGAHTLNGSTSTVQAYPVSDAITGFLWVTNTGATAANMSVTATSGGASMASCDLGSVAAKSLVYITDHVEACLTAASVTSGRAQLVVTVNAPAADIDVYAGYKVDADSDRLSLTVN